MNWSYKFAFDELQDFLDSRPWLLVDDDFSSANNTDFLGMQKQIFQDRGWEWFKNALRGRLFPKLNLTTLTTWNGERNPAQGDPDPNLVAKVEQEFPGVSIVSLVGNPHVVSGPPVPPNVLSYLKKSAQNQYWKLGLEKTSSQTSKYAADNNRLRQLISDVWLIPTWAAAGGVLAWLLSLGIPPAQLEQQLQAGATPQQIITQVAPEKLPPEQSPTPAIEPNNADFPGNKANFANPAAETLDNDPENASMPRGVRNNNPGNLERNKTVWQGMTEDQNDERFITFSSPEYGIRAMARVLKNYGRRHGLRTVEQIISRWAPSSENQTDSYIQHVSQELGTSPAVPLNLNDPDLLTRLIRAMIKHENGFDPYDDETVARGVALEKSGKTKPRIFHHAYQEIDFYEAKRLVRQFAGLPWNPTPGSASVVEELLRAGVPRQLFSRLYQDYVIERSHAYASKPWSHAYTV